MNIVTTHSRAPATKVSRISRVRYTGCVRIGSRSVSQLEGPDAPHAPLFSRSIRLPSIHPILELDFSKRKTRAGMGERLFFSVSLIADGPNQRATTLPIPHVVSRDLPISPRFTPTSFCLNTGPALLLHLVNQWLNFSYSHPHAFRYRNQKKNSLLRRLELSNSDLVDIC